ncbi:hypothetical protein [Actinoplanes sp. NBRC 103695]|uniref:DUF5983 family protein n=1 Tax=Actinoplanes sp. NBRC 103695 TaxID=3032202 RepID=UPI0024A1B3B4|nr:hypothetical protein [Actinoplanes sp. NBRC 103695]GLZ00798.1 hypothetical protein Acsp02_80500 [Actinoplanes sp. NBRC 103695]
MLIRLERVQAQHDVTVLDAAQTFAVSKDVDEPDPDGTYSIITVNGEDGIQVAGSEQQLHGWLNRARAQLRAATGGPRIMNVLDLSTNHLPEQVCAHLSDYYGVTAHDTLYGWLVVVPGDLSVHRVHHPDTVPDVVWALWEYAHRFGAEYLKLDANADQVDGLASWDW